MASAMPSFVVIKDDGTSGPISDARTILATRPKAKVRFYVAPDCPSKRREDIRRLLTSAGPERRWAIVTDET